MAGEFAAGGADAAAAGVIGARLGTIAGTTAGGGQFAYHPNELRALIKEWNDLALSYDADFRNVANLMKVRGPGEDYASQSLAGAVNRSGSALDESLRREQVFCEEQARKMERALKAYLGAETSTAEDMDRREPGTVF